MNSSENLPANSSVDFNENSSFVDGASLSLLDTTNRSGSTTLIGQNKVDAVHPFFTSYRNIEQYYCRECNVPFETHPKSLKHHFTTKKHTPIDNCTYCKLPVYEYIHNEKTVPYHRCYEMPTSFISEEDNQGVEFSEKPLNSSSLCVDQLSNTSPNQLSTTIDNSSVSDISTDNTSV